MRLLRVCQTCTVTARMLRFRTAPCSGRLKTPGMPCAPLPPLKNRLFDSPQSLYNQCEAQTNSRAAAQKVVWRDGVASGMIEIRPFLPASSLMRDLRSLCTARNRMQLRSFGLPLATVLLSSLLAGPSPPRKPRRPRAHPLASRIAGDWRSSAPVAIPNSKPPVNAPRTRPGRRALQPGPRQDAAFARARAGTAASARRRAREPAESLLDRAIVGGSRRRHSPRLTPTPPPMLPWLRPGCRAKASR